MALQIQKTSLTLPSSLLLAYCRRSKAYKLLTRCVLTLSVKTKAPQMRGFLYRCGQCVDIDRNKSIYFSNLHAKNKPV